MINSQKTIAAPHLLTRRHRARDTLLTAIMWALYLYLWLPALSLVAWILGIEFAYDGQQFSFALQNSVTSQRSCAS